MALIDIEKGLAELKAKTMIDIEKATSITWGGRAAASYRLSREAASVTERLTRFYEGETFRGEAMEHAAMVEDGGTLLRGVHDEIDVERKPALDALNKALGAR